MFRSGGATDAPRRVFRATLSPLTAAILLRLLLGRGQGSGVRGSLRVHRLLLLLLLLLFHRRLRRLLRPLLLLGPGAVAPPRIKQAGL